MIHELIILRQSMGSNGTVNIDPIVSFLSPFHQLLQSIWLTATDLLLAALHLLFVSIQ